jgi:hypothetical protein
MVLVNLITSNSSRFLVGREFTEAPMVGDEVEYNHTSSQIDGIWRVDKRMWRDGGLAVDIYCTKVK